MNIESLQYFHDVATLKSISKVASKSHISQSALSQQLSKLEETFGVTALNRSNKGVELTAEGEIILNYSKEILNIYNNLEQELENIKSEKSTLSIETDCFSGAYILPKILPKFSSKFNDYSYNIKCNCDHNTHSNLINEFCDISIGTSKVNDSDFVSHHIGSDELLFVCKSSYSLDIEQLPFLLLKDENNIENRIKSFINSENIVLRTDFLITIISSLLETPSVAVLPKLCITKELEQNVLKKIDVHNFTDNKYNLYLTHRKNIGKDLKEKVSFLIRSINSILG